MNRAFFTKFSLALLVALKCSTSPAMAETSNDQALSAEIVLIQALAASPVVKDIDAAMAVRLADALDTKLRLNPQLSAVVGLPVQPAGDADRTQIGATLSQPLRVSDFGVRHVVANLLTEAGNLEQRLAILELSQNVSLSYAKIWILQKQQAYFQEQRSRADKTRQQIEVASSRGAISRGDVGLFTSEHKKISAQLVGVDSDLKREQATLLRLSSLNAAGRTLSPPKKTLQLSLDAIRTSARDGALPVQARYQLLRQMTQERARLARQDAFPIVSPQLTYQRTEDGGVFVGGGLQFDLPIFNRNQPEIARRDGEAAAALARSNYFQGEFFQQEIELMVQSLDSLRVQAETFETDIVPTLQSALRVYNEQFLAGTGTPLTVWQTQRELSSAQQLALELWMRFFAMRSELSVLIGQHL